MLGALRRVLNPVDDADRPDAAREVVQAAVVADLADRPGDEMPVANVDDGVAGRRIELADPAAAVVGEEVVVDVVRRETAASRARRTRRR